LKTAYHEIGLNVNRTILQLLIHRYGIIGDSKKDAKNIAKGLTFDDFIHSSMKLKHSIDIWNEKLKTTQSPHPGNVPLGPPFSNYKSPAPQSIPTFTLEEVSFDS
jgi:hypothetical protein